MTMPKHAFIYGTHSQLGDAIEHELHLIDWRVSRGGRSIAEHDIYVFPGGEFTYEPFINSIDIVEMMVRKGFTGIMKQVAEAIETSGCESTDYILIGSTSSYEGFANTAIYCAIKHGLVGLVRSLNKEYADTATRFWLFSPGTMNTRMGRQLSHIQDPYTFLDPADVAKRIVDTVISSARTNCFEPEVVIRRRMAR